ncbi:MULTISPECIES: LD-carboxypeptidase LdcB/DacB [unclassified Streptococcus]|uniref:LD-carboxypeptidase LdcB/DacB n=1 Tax=unclassified Streptococcus TaxID=2608887 RepID=UPI00359E309A
MKSKVIILACGLILLTACGNKQTETTSTAKSSASSTTVSKVADSQKAQDQSSSNSSAMSQESPKSSQENTPVSEDKPETETAASQAASTPSTGFYHSVRGKYGDVIIVNKKHPLAADYNPGEDGVAGAAFRELLGAMRAAGFSVSDNYSGFRSYDYQASLYQSYVNQDGQAAADRYSARPGYSEHQTGLAFDVLDASGQLLEEPAASQWLANNAHHYGFVVRYLPGKENITGYMAESWHVRYIGQEATEVYQSGLTLEEYYGVEGGDY